MLRKRYSKADFNATFIHEKSFILQSQESKLWAIQSRPNRERETTVLIFRKATLYAAKNSAGNIFSICCRDEHRNFVYIEALMLLHVKDVINHIPSVLSTKI